MDICILIFYKPIPLPQKIVLPFPLITCWLSLISEKQSPHEDTSVGKPYPICSNICDDVTGFKVCGYQKQKSKYLKNELFFVQIKIIIHYTWLPYFMFYWSFSVPFRAPQIVYGVQRTYANFFWLRHLCAFVCIFPIDYRSLLL